MQGCVREWQGNSFRLECQHFLRTCDQLRPAGNVGECCLLAGWKVEKEPSEQGKQHVQKALWPLGACFGQVSLLCL